MSIHSQQQSRMEIIAEESSALGNIYKLTLPDGEPTMNADVVMHGGFFDIADSQRLFYDLLHGVQWRQDTMKLYGKEVNFPRLTAWYGDEDRSYTFSGVTMHPTPWTPTLTYIKHKVEEVADCQFNSVLLNYYRSGNDSISWHTDAEPELGTNPIIASVSLGGARRFKLRHLKNKDIKTEVELTDGSLLIMAGETQHFWQHQIPKTASIVKPRINLTFRQIKM